jgi:hypothetical protein
LKAGDFISVPVKRLVPQTDVMRPVLGRAFTIVFVTMQCSKGVRSMEGCCIRIVHFGWIACRCVGTV